MQAQRQGKGPRYHGSQQGKPATILIARSAQIVMDEEGDQTALGKFCLPFRDPFRRRGCRLYLVRKELPTSLDPSIDIPSTEP